MTGERHGSSIRAITVASLLLLVSASGPETFEVELWANDDSAAHLPGVVETNGHPCGASALVRLSRMPPHVEPEGPLGTELVAEAGAGGSRWSVPLNYVPVAVDGTALLVALSGGRLWIETDGRIRRDPPGRDYPPGADRVCPVPGAFDASAYAQCTAFTDLSSGKLRLIEYEAPCT